MDSPMLRDELAVLAAFVVVATDYLARGKLVRVLEDWFPPFDGYFL